MVIPDNRRQLEDAWSPERYRRVLARLEERAGVTVPFRVAEYPVLLERALLDEMAGFGAEVARELLNDAGYLAQARLAIPPEFCTPGETNRPHFLAAEFGLVRGQDGRLSARLTDVQAFPSAYGFQALLAGTVREVYELGGELGCFLGGLDSSSYWNALALTILGHQDPESVVLTDVDPEHQKTRADLHIISRKLGLALVDIAELEGDGNRLFYRNRQGRPVPIRRIYNRATPEQLAGRGAPVSIDFRRRWDVEWAGHPNWYFLISRYSLPKLSRSRSNRMIMPAVFLDEFLDGDGKAVLEEAGAQARVAAGGEYEGLVLKPVSGLGSIGVRIAPSEEELRAIPAEHRRRFIVQQRVEIAPWVTTPEGPAEAEVRVLYCWPHGGCLTPLIPQVRLRRGAAMETGGDGADQFAGITAAYGVT